MPFDIENTSSGKHKEMPKVGSEGARNVGKVLGRGEPGKASGFRPGGRNGYNVCGGSSGMQVKIPEIRDQSKVK